MMPRRDTTTHVHGTCDEKITVSSPSETQKYLRVLKGALPAILRDIVITDDSPRCTSSRIACLERLGDSSLTPRPKSPVPMMLRGPSRNQPDHQYGCPGCATSDVPKPSHVSLQCRGRTAVLVERIEVGYG
ncbi:hypothetical protein BJV78DRAFT_904482 [Lactifluus subvellereus]|nr:hypothetical protein BJV78DRAFT_904482 [Lactifluus subvellereus]